MFLLFTMGFWPTVACVALAIYSVNREERTNRRVSRLENLYAEKWEQDAY